MIRPATQRGFTIVSAIFILVVLAGLAAAILTVSTSQQMGTAWDVQGAQAYQAARAGIEFGLFQRLRGGACPVGTASFTPPGGATSLAGFTVSVTCTAYGDGSGGPTVFEIESVACNVPNGGSCPGNSTGANYIERRLRVSL